MSSRGWAWVAGGQETPSYRSSFVDGYEGTYTAACPHCGDDCLWSAYLTVPMCPCMDMR